MVQLKPGAANMLKKKESHMYSADLHFIAQVQGVVGAVPF